MESVIQNKLKSLIEKFKDSDYVLDNYYGDSIINKLSSKSDPEIEWLEKSPFLSDLLITALDTTENTHVTVKVFLIRLLAIISRNELHFGKIFAKQGDSIANAFHRINSSDIKPSLKVAYMEVALAIVQHNSGITWLLKTESWRNVLDLCNDKQTVFVVRQIYKFACEILWRLDALKDEESILNVVGVILKPLSENDYVNMVTVTSEEEAEHARVLEPLLHMLLSLFNDASKIRQKTLLMSILINNFKITQYLYIITELMHKEDINALMTKAIFWLTVAKMFLVKPMSDDAVYVKEDVMETSVTYFNIIQFFIKRRSATSILDYCNSCIIIWSQVWQGKGPSFEKSDGRKIEIELELMLIPVVPLLVYVKSKNKGKPACAVDTSSDLINNFILKLLDSSREHTSRAAYAMRDLVMELDLTTMALHSVKRLSCLKNHVSNTQANLIFQALFYILRDEASDNGTHPDEPYEDTEERCKILTYVMDTVLMLIKNFNINWQDSFEVLCLYTIVSDILKKPNQTCKFTVASLNVIAVTVMKFQPPSLSLLMESRPGENSSINNLGKMTYTKLHDMNWEIRDSALELLFVCTDIAFVKFPPFQKQIMENSLIEISATMALNDHEFYVQSSALKCLGAACKVACLWEQLKVTRPDIEEQLISILRVNQEGIVRKEAAKALCSVYKHVKISPNIRNLLYKHMVSSALTDFHWEVQIEALKFWEQVIQTYLSEQGMLDGTFPPVTFSKETRKIVTLNDKEVQKRLIKCLEELTNVGCLTVLVMLLDEDTEIDIMNHALTISLNFIEILKRYKVTDALAASKEDLDNMNEIVKGLKHRNGGNDIQPFVEDRIAENSESIIEGILNSNDINLLANIYENQLNLNGKESNAEPKVVLENKVTPAMFVGFLSSRDFKDVIKQKIEWNEGIRSLSSLLDDVLGNYEIHDEDVNTMDCY